MNKRGQGLSTGAIVLIILGVIVLAILAFGFSLGWNKLMPFLSTNSNVNTVSTQCSTACATGVTYDYCSQQRNVTTNGKTYQGTCAAFASASIGSIKIYDSKNAGTTATSSDAADIQSFAIAKCSSVSC